MSRNLYFANTTFQSLDADDYIFEENEDFYNTVDYSLQPTVDYYLQQEMSHKTFVQFSLEGLGFVLGQAIVISVLWIIGALLQLQTNFPGHINSQWWPLYVPDYYGDRCSQHLFDPYSFVHFGHGILSFYAFGFLDYDKDFEFDFQSNFDITEKSRDAGLLLTLVSATFIEQMENSPVTIQLFRNNTGKTLLPTLNR